jgi:hypothetical protein
LLIDSLKGVGVCFNSNKATQKKQRQEEFASFRKVDLYLQQETILAGWQGQPKGMLQVLWERGLSDESLEKSTLDWKKDPITGKVDLQLSL